MKKYLVRFVPDVSYCGCIENTIDIEAESVLDAVNCTLESFLVDRFIFVKPYED